MQLFHMHPFYHLTLYFSFLPSFLPSTLIPTSVFAPPTRFLSHTLPLSVCPSLSVTSVPVEHGHKSGRRLFVSTNVDESSKKLNC